MAAKFADSHFILARGGFPSLGSAMMAILSPREDHLQPGVIERLDEVCVETGF